MPRRLIIILIGIAVLVIPAVIAVVVINRSPKLQNTVLKLANINTNSANTNSSANTNLSLNTNSPAAADQTQITYVSRNFAEVYGSGSNQNNLSNISEAKKWATKSYADFLNREINRLRLAQATTPYQETITKTLVVTVTKQAANTAAVTIGTQRQETIDHDQKVYYQDLLVDLLKVGSEWKVNAALWKAL